MIDDLESVALSICYNKHAQDYPCKEPCALCEDQAAAAIKTMRAMTDDVPDALEQTMQAIMVAGICGTIGYLFYQIGISFGWW